MTATAQATATQNAAADPRSSAWVSANAGSGKTRVLTDRVARLLLGGTPPERILCLTFTKTAAANMQNKLVARLAEWAMMPTVDLRRQIAALGEDERAIDEAALARARRLFAQALEVPGGLRIGTIHAFCAGLLRRFPLEAGIAPDFRELDERAAKVLSREVLEGLTACDPALIQRIFDIVGETGIDDLARSCLRERIALGAVPTRARIEAAIGARPGDGLAALWADTLGPGGAGVLAALTGVLAGGSTKDVGAHAKLSSHDWTTPSHAALEALEATLLHGPGAEKAGPFTARTGKFPTKATRAMLTDAQQDNLDALMGRVEAGRLRRFDLLAVEMNETVLAFAADYTAAYEAAKADKGQADFDDLILRARALLSNSATAEWVLYRLDGGLDHILVDEAQDTAPAQWDVIRLLAETFLAADATDTRLRTVFAVGDIKQSIYSFQGADPVAFAAMRDHFRDRLTAQKRPFHPTELAHSFRSAPPILAAVDATFPDGSAQGLGEGSRHLAIRADMPGRVELHPFVVKEGATEPPPLEDPVDHRPPGDPAIVIAQSVAARCRAILGSGQLVPHRDGPRPAVPGDILILVQRRKAIFDEVIPALLAAGLPVAGSDRLQLAEALAVRDLIALLRFLALPEDDLSLAAVLRSPICGLSEGDLYRLAQPRKGYLWAALRDGAAPQYGPARDLLRDLRDHVDLLRPYEVLQRALIRHGARARLIGRLGAESADAIDGLLAQVLAQEAAGVPTLDGFLDWFERDEVEIKREMEASPTAIRVMTVHGAKGLEAPIVILPETGPIGATPPRRFTRIGGLMLWPPPATHLPAPFAVAREAAAAATADEKARLLYVAMTRAEHWLIVMGGGDPAKAAGCWHDVIAAGMRAAGGVADRDGVIVLENKGFGAKGAALAAVPGHLPDPPRWAITPAPAPDRPSRPLAPSNLSGQGAATGGAGLGAEVALARGRALHRLLEVLPGVLPARRAGIARLAIDPADAALIGDTDAVLEEAVTILEAADLAVLFGPGSLAEVGITAPLGSFADKVIAGVIDRLIVTPDRVLAVDFKSHAEVPEDAAHVPPEILVQMGAYAEALARIYPDRVIETAILWTRSARLMPLNHEMVSSALARAATP